MITSEQIRAARAMLRWEQKDLAEASKVSLPSIKRLETIAGELAAQERTVTALRQALEAAGIEFTNDGRPGVRLRFPDIEAVPVDDKWKVKVAQVFGAPVRLYWPHDARQRAREAEANGDARLASALRKAADDADRYAAGRV